MKKRALCFFMIGSMALSMAGCGDTVSSVQSPAAEEPYTIRVAYSILQTEQPDLEKVQEKVNEITLKKINARVELKGVRMRDMKNTYTVMAANQEKLDLMMLSGGAAIMPDFALNNIIQPIGDLLDKYGEDIKASQGDYLHAGTFNGIQYGVPQKVGATFSGGMQFLKSIIKKYNIDLSKVKKLDDLDPIFEKIHENEKNLLILAPGQVSIGLIGNLTSFDNLSNGLGVLENGGLDELKVVNKYESPQWIKAVKKIREWYKKGYISSDVAVSQIDGTTLQDQEKVFAVTSNVSPHNGVQGLPVPRETVRFTEPIMTGSLAQMQIWAISSSCERPDKAMQLLNLMYQDVELSTLLRYGIKGEHYEVKNDGTCDLSKGNESYNMLFDLFGDIDKIPLNAANVMASGGDVEVYKRNIANWQKNSKYSKAYGFTFNPSAVKTEIAAVQAVVQEYKGVIEGGQVDPDTEIKKFNDKLYAAGLQRIIDEKQRQLDRWAAADKRK